MGSGVKALRALFIAIVFLGVISLLFTGIVANQATTSRPSKMVSSPRNLKRWRFFGQEKHSFDHDIDINCVSKRKVPNGPDPIHNRRAEKSRQPPGRD